MPSSRHRLFLSVAALSALCAGCSGNPGKAPESKPYSGTLTLAGGQPLGDVMLHLHPLKPGFAAGAEVDAGGAFASEAPPGDYAWSVRRSEKAKPAASEAVLKKVPAKYLETDLSRTVRIGTGSAIAVVVD